MAIPFGSMTAAMTQDMNERTSLASFRYIGGSSGSVVVAALTLPLVSLFASPQLAFPIVVACFALIGAIFCFLCFLNTKVIFHGTENLKKVDSYFVASAHQSMFETFALQIPLDGPIFILKKELFFQNKNWTI